MTQQVTFGDIPAVTLGWRIQLALDHGQLNQADLMSKFEVSRQTVSRWCNDVGAPPKKFILETIAEMCGVFTVWLIDGLPGLDPPPPARPLRPLRAPRNTHRKDSPPDPESGTYPPVGVDPRIPVAA